MALSGFGGDCCGPSQIFWLHVELNLRHCQSKIVDLSYSTEDRGLGLPELTPLGNCSAVELEIENEFSCLRRWRLNYKTADKKQAGWG